MTFGSRSGYTSEALHLRRIGFGLQSMMEIAFLLLMVVAIGPVKGRAAESCVCTNEFKEVCGSDGVTYSNSCRARCSGATVKHDGKCEDKKTQYSTDLSDCSCHKIYRPVCGSDGRTYNNECLAKCNGVSIVQQGECQPCVCPEIFLPVCGADGKTYGNKCKAACSGVLIVHQGECQSKKGCICPSVFHQVCGTDGRTYDNECKATCSGVLIVHQGECQSKKGCICPSVFHQVCGTDGRTYDNECKATCSKVKVLHEGPCEVKPNCSKTTSSGCCACDKSLLRVCGNDGVTYDNADCAKRCGGVTVYVTGACDVVCKCTKEYDPVCHVITGTKYTNRCLARCLGADSRKLKPCNKV